MDMRGAKARRWLFDEAGSWKLRCEAEENGSLPQNEARAGRDAEPFTCAERRYARCRSWRVGCCKSAGYCLSCRVCCVVGYDLDAAGASMLGTGFISPDAALPASSLTLSLLHRSLPCQLPATSSTII